MHHVRSIRDLKRPTVPKYFFTRQMQAINVSNYHYVGTTTIDYI